MSRPGKPADERFMWCVTHDSPGHLFVDGSKGCWWEDVVESREDEHEFIPLHEALTKRGARRAALEGGKEK